MLVRRDVLRECAKIAGDEAGRYGLSCLLVESDGTVVATDGHRLIRAKFNGVEPADFPTVEGVNPCDDTRTMIPAATAKAVPQLRRATMPCLTFAAVDGAQRKIGTTDLESPQVQTYQEAEGQFPKYETAMQAGEPKAAMLVDPSLLVGLLQVMGKLQDSRYSRVRLEVFESEQHPMIRLTCTGNGGESVALLCGCQE